MTKEQQRSWTRRYKFVSKRLSEILFEEDPIGINFGGNTDEYDPEVGSIMRRLRMCRDVEGVRRLVHQEFVDWFDADIAGPPEKYQKIAQIIWDEKLPEKIP